MFPQNAEGGGDGEGDTRATRAGGWTYTAWTPEKGATLHQEGQKVDLHYSSSIFEDFLETMNRLQAEFGRRSSDAGPSGATTEEHAEKATRV
ncbi:hypothetical protein ABZ934_04650 [Streptomyces sp. NPDC046557]|uniref:hypothetical protein n=1 Tax=Streptomyces sp. NPDC046557 TaxID=3155372 RepID=UPI0033E4DBED